MKAKRELKLAVRSVARINRICSRDREAIEELWDNYETACRLSAGPDESRSKAWERNAKEREQKLKDTLKKHKVLKRQCI